MADADTEKSVRARVAGGITLAIAGVALFGCLFAGLADWLKDQGSGGLPILFVLRAAACWAVAGGGWVAYKAWKRM